MFPGAHAFLSAVTTGTTRCDAKQNTRSRSVVPVCPERTSWLTALIDEVEEREL